AIKFGRGRPIEVKVSKKPRYAVLEVRDHGIGVAPEARERIFRPFERGEFGRHYAGMGLGLYIVRTIVAGLGGEVRVKGREGDGSVFSVELPLKDARE